MLRAAERHTVISNIAVVLCQALEDRGVDGLITFLMPFNNSQERPSGRLRALSRARASEKPPVRGEERRVDYG